MSRNPDISCFNPPYSWGEPTPRMQALPTEFAEGDNFFDILASTKVGPANTVGDRPTAGVEGEKAWEDFMYREPYINDYEELAGERFVRVRNLFFRIRNR